MAEEFKILLGAELRDGELDNIRNQINNIQVSPITLTMNTRNVQNQLNSIRTQIQNLSNIRINLTGGNGNTGVQRTVADVTRAYNDLMNLQRRINSIRLQIGGLDANKKSSQISALSGQLNRLMTDYNNLYQAFNRDFSTDQLDNLSRSFEVATGKIQALNAKISDTEAVRQTESAYRELYSIAKQIDGLELKIGSLDGKANANEIAELTSQLGTLRQTYQQLSSSLQGRLSATQLSNLSATVYDTQDKLRQLDAKVADTKRRLAKGINVKFDNGTFANDMNKVATSLSRINTQSAEVVFGIQELNAAFLAMETAKGKNDIDGLIASYEQYQTALKNVNNQIEINQRVEQQNTNASKLASAKQALSSQMDVWLKNNSAAAKQFGGQIDSIKERLASCDKVQLGGLKAEFKEITRQAELAGKATQTIGDRFKEQMSKLGIYFSASMLISQGARAMRDMYDNVVDVDTAMTSLYRVTDLTSEQYDALYDNMISSAKEYGSTLTDIINSTADWVRLGFNANTANQLSEISAMYQHISDLNYNTAVENLVTAYKGFQDQLVTLYDGDSVAAVEYVADIFNELGNNYAVAAEDVGAALTRSSAALSLAGNTIQQAAAMSVGITEVTQDPDKAGSSLKVLSMRLRGMKGELQDLGEEVDENVESLSKMQTQILNLTSGKVNIFNDDGSFKSTYEIMDGIAEIYNSLDPTKQADLLETVAGKNRANDIAALIKNWSQVEKAMNSAMNASGSAAKENERYMNSIQGHLDALSASWQALSNTFIKSDFVKTFVSVLTDIADALNYIIDKIGTLPVLLGAIAGVMSAKSNFGIFSTFDTQLTGVINKLGVFGKSFKDITRDAKSSQGIFTALFSNLTNKNGITNKDVDCITNFMTQIKNGVPTGQAWASTMKGATVAGKQMAKQVKIGAVELGTLTESANTSKLAMVGLQVATTALNIALTMGISFAIQAIVSGLDKLIHSAQIASEKADELKDSSMQAAEEAKEEIETLNELIDKYKELARKDNQDVSTRTEIKSIQGQITDLVGQQAKNLDLVNGKLDEEYAKLLQIKKEEAAKSVEKNVTAYHYARDAANKAKGSMEGTFVHPTLGATYDYVGSRDKAAEEILRSSGVATELNMTKGGYFQNTLYFQALGTTAKEKAEYLQKAIDALKTAEGYDYASSDLYNTLVKQRDAYLDYTDDVTESAEGLLDSVVVLSEYDAELLKINVDSVDKFKEYRDKLYNLVVNSPDLSEAFASGDITTESVSKSIDDYLSTLPQFEDYYNEWKNDGSFDVKISFADLIKDTNKDNDFIDRVSAYIEKVNTLQDTLKSLKDGDFSSSDFVELVKEFPELSDNADDLEHAIVKMLGTMNTDITSEFASQFGKMDAEEDIEALQNFQDAVLELGQVVGSTQFAIDISVETDGMESLFKAIKESVSSTGLTAESIKNLKARYQDLENYDAARLFERTSNGIHLNTKALRELESAYEKQMKQKVNDNLQDLVDQYNELTKGINSTSDAAKKAELYAQRSDIQDQINDTADLAAQYEGLTSAFYKWEQAQSVGEEGDMYDGLASGLENIKELYEEGLIGTNKFRTAVQLMSNEDLSTASIDELINAYETGYSKMTRYFTDSSDGCLNFLNDVQKLNSEWVKMNEDGSWDINFGVGGDQDVADALGINVESVQSIMRKLSDYGFDINLDSMYTSFDFLQTSAEKANQKLIELGKTEIQFNFDTTNIETLNTQIAEAQTLLDIFKNGDGTVDLTIRGAEEAQEILATLIGKKQLLNAPSVMSVDTTQANSNISMTISLLQDFQTNYNDIEIETAVGADTTTAQTNIQDVLTKLDEIPNDIKAKLGLDSAEFTTAVETLKSADVDVEAGVNLDQTALDTITSTISAITPEMMVTAGLDSSLIDGYEPEDENATVEYDVDDSAIQSYTPPDKTAEVKYIATMNSWTPPTKYGTVIYTPKIQGGAGAHGTAYANGTLGKAYRKGDWGTKGSGIALGGELGQELVVRDGHFFTIGDKSAEFFNYKKGDIIFNAEQTKQIFSKGKISSGSRRGVALANGTAHAEGKAFSDGDNPSYIWGDGKVITTPLGSGNGSDKEFKETFDWIEVAIDRLERAIKRLDLTSSSVYKSWSSRNVALKDQIGKIKEEIALQSSGYDRYMQQANSVGLPESWAAKVRNGEIDINTIGDEGLTEQIAEQIKEYQEWYEKAISCKDAIDESNESLSECYQIAFDNIVTQYDGILSVIEYEKNMLNEYISQVESGGYITSTKYYEALIDNEEKTISELQNQRNALLSSLEDAVSSGAIAEGSEAWYEMVGGINEVTLAIEESKTSVIEYTKAIKEIEWEVFDLLQSSISQITKEADFLIDLMSGQDLYSDGGQLTNEGKATMGLHAQNYNVYMAQADEYAQEILKINQELANDPNNQDLIDRKRELLELQQESILAAEDEKQAIVDMVSEGIELELDALQELISTYTDALDAQKDLYDYQKKIAKQTKEISSLEKQLSAYAGDTSEEAKAKIQQIKVSLEDAKDNLEDAQYERYISDTKQLLDELYLEYETTLNQRLDNIDGLISEMILSVNDNSGIIATTIYAASDKVGYTLSAEMQNIWKSSLQNAQAEYQQRIEQTTAIVNQLVANGLLSQQDANNIISTLANGDAQSAQETLDLINQMVINGQLSQQDANGIITALSLGNQQQVADSLALLNQLVNNGAMSQREANSIISALVTGDAGAIANANKIIGQLVSNGSISQQDANKIISALDSSKTASNNVVTQYGKNFSDKATTINDTLLEIKKVMDSMLKKMDADASDAISNTPTATPTTTPTPTPPSNSNNSTNPSNSNNSTKTRSDKEYYGVALAIWNGNYGWGNGSDRTNRLKAKGFDPNKVQTIINQMDKDGYVHSGAWYGKYHGITSLTPYHYNKFVLGAHDIPKDQWAWTQEKGREMIVRPSDGAILTPLAKQDSVLNAGASNNIWNMANSPTDFIRENLKLGEVESSDLQHSSTTYTQNLEQVVFSLPNVKNYDEMLKSLKDDKNFERLITAMTIDRMVGKTSLAKGKSIR